MGSFLIKIVAFLLRTVGTAPMASIHLHYREDELVQECSLKGPGLRLQIDYNDPNSTNSCIKDVNGLKNGPRGLKCTFEAAVPILKLQDL